MAHCPCHVMAWGVLPLTLPAEANLGESFADVAAEVDRTHARRDALAAEIEEVFLAHPFGKLGDHDVGDRATARIADPGRDR